MAGLVLEGVSKRFGATRAVDAVDLAVEAGEFVAVLGPSGCGKTTLLRLVAGFETPEAGRIVLDGRVVAGAATFVPPEERRVGIVFQSYALWPHMDVAGNVGYALTVARLPAPERARRVAAALASVGLEGFDQRRPQELSGGQRQRVALARCLAMEPAMLLLDEPLANLDVHLRAAMIDEFRAAHARVGTTTLYITHDQAEAMALATRVAVMEAGRILQLAPPRTLYREPASASVGAFVGRGAIVPVEVLGADGDGRVRARLFGVGATLRAAPGQRPGPAQACLRPENLALADADAPDTVRARIVGALYRGAHDELELAPDAAPATLLRVDSRNPHAAGAAIGVRIDDGWVIPG